MASFGILQLADRFCQSTNYPRSLPPCDPFLPLLRLSSIKLQALILVFVSKEISI
jgi:hypothetical protein